MNRHKISVDEFLRLPRVRVVCDASPAHRKRYIVADYLKLRESPIWVLMPANPRQWFGKGEIQGEVHLRADQPIPRELNLGVQSQLVNVLVAPERIVYPNACPCQGCAANRPLRADRLTRLLNGATEELGLDVVTLRDLTAWASRLVRDTP